MDLNDMTQSPEMTSSGFYKRNILTLILNLYIRMHFDFDLQFRNFDIFLIFDNDFILISIFDYSKTMFFTYY